MKTEHAVRYLLLRHLKSFETALPSKELAEVMTSLSVVPEGRGHRLRWRLAGHEQERPLPPGTFTLYRRGDIPGGRTGVERENRDNNAVARDLASAMLGVRAEAADRLLPGEALEPLRLWSAGELVLLTAGLWYPGGLHFNAALALLAFGAAEFGARGRLYASWLLLPLAVCAPPTAALLAGLACAGLQLLDPDARWRGVRVAACVLAAAVSGARLVSMPPDPGSLSTAAFLAPLMIALFTVRWLHGTHFRAVPLVLPIFCLGLALDGPAPAAWMGAGTLTLATLGRLALRRLLPVQRQRGLTPNG